MREPAVIITSLGVVSVAGAGAEATLSVLRAGERPFAPLSLFSGGPDGPLPVAEVRGLVSRELPRTHELARLAADQALRGITRPPEAIVLGCTTGGMAVTEVALRAGERNPHVYARHALATVAEDLARYCGCTGPLITLSTACSSGAAAIAIAARMVRSGMVRSVLAGGADGLCCLTYFGFKSLQLLDPAGARPLDRDRRGMTIGEGAALLLLTAQNDLPEGRSDVLVLMGSGFSCDAYHPTTPHPCGEGALAAMRSALDDAGVTSDHIDYVNLHGTGTYNNDLSEALAVNALFGARQPRVSSTKGITGHSLAAAGAIEAVISALALRHHFVPRNAGLSTSDPRLNLNAVRHCEPRQIRTVLSNSFGFGGNNVSLVIGRSKRKRASHTSKTRERLIVRGYSCLSGAGCTDATLAAWAAQHSCHGCLSEETICAGLSQRVIRRLKRLPKIVLAMAQELKDRYGADCVPQAISLGTGWGALSETSDFIMNLWRTDCQFPSPIDFIGSVHNAAAGQLAMQFQAKGANLTTTGGDYSFEQALMAAELATSGSNIPVLIMGADEAHSTLTPIFDASAISPERLSDGGGALLLQRGTTGTGVAVESLFYRSHRDQGALAALGERLGAVGPVNREFGAVFAGCPAACLQLAQRQLEQFRLSHQFEGPVVEFRRLTGEFASATALAAVAAVVAVERGQLGDPTAPGRAVALDGKGILLLGLGESITALGICPA